MKREIIRMETNDWSSAQSGDVVSFSYNDDPSFVIVGVPVKGRRRRYIETEWIDDDPRPRRVYIDRSHKDLTLKSIVRTIETAEKKYKARFTELDFTRPAVKVGSRASIEQALEAVEDVVDYFDQRLKEGQLLLDQWEGDAYKSAAEASESLRKLIKSISGE